MVLTDDVLAVIDTEGAATAAGATTETTDDAPPTGIADADGPKPGPAVRKLLEQTGVKLEDIDVFEVNEAFAAQALAVCRDLGLPMDKTNPNGSGISLGHPIGATGSIVTTKALFEMQRIGSRYGLVTMCIGGGQGIAALFESIH